LFVIKILYSIVVDTAILKGQSMLKKMKKKRRKINFRLKSFKIGLRGKLRRNVFYQEILMHRVN